MSETQLDGFEWLKDTAFPVPDKEKLSAMPCGLHRAKLEESAELLPGLVDLFESAPVEHADDWFVDVKIHMLMDGQYPCIPNWHCDNIPRRDGKTDYASADPGHLMMIWLSDSPETEVIDLPEPASCGRAVSDHKDLRHAIAAFPTRRLQPRAWYSFSQLSPHRGTRATRNGWRVFCRLTHKSIVSHRPVQSVIRRHAQVYLDAAEFAW